MYQIGTEGGFLPDVAPHPNGIPIPLDLVADPTGNTADPTGPFNLLLAPAERADVLIDFTDRWGKLTSFTTMRLRPSPGEIHATTITPGTRTSLTQPTTPMA